MPDKLREIRIKCPASHTFLSCFILIPLSSDSRKDMFTDLSHALRRVQPGEHFPNLKARAHFNLWETVFWNRRQARIAAS
jgi:hypothetical protein